jgi:hypothetical protein
VVLFCCAMLLGYILVCLIDCSRFGFDSDPFASLASKKARNCLGRRIGHSVWHKIIICHRHTAARAVSLCYSGS